MTNDQVQLIIEARRNIKKVMHSMRPGPGMDSVALEDRAFYEEFNRIQQDLKHVVNMNSYDRNVYGALGSLGSLAKPYRGEK